MNYPDDVSGADIERAHGGPDLHDLFTVVRARLCVACTDVLVPSTRLLCAECGREAVERGSVDVYECRRCGKWIDYDETGPHAATHATNGAA